MIPAGGKRRRSGMQSSMDGSQQRNMKRLLVKFLTDDDIASLTLPEIIELIKILADEAELRAMAMADYTEIDYSKMPFSE